MIFKKAKPKEQTINSDVIENYPLTAYKDDKIIIVINKEMILPEKVTFNSFFEVLDYYKKLTSM